MIYPGVYSVIVTYGNRIKYLRKTISACINVGVDKLIIIGNGLNQDCRIKLETIRNIHPKRILVHHFSTNKGSALAYKTGVKLCSTDPLCNFIWLLDDDNCPDSNSLRELVIFWKTHVIGAKSKIYALSSYRKDREIYKKAIFRNEPKLMLGPINSFSGFHFKRTYNIFKEKIKPIHKVGKIKHGLNKKYGQIYVAPYGGLFFNKELIKKIGFPDETYFVYADDYDYTSRISEAGGKIILILQSKITDLEKSFNTKRGLLTSRMLSSTSELKCYYMFRNSIRFEAKKITSKPIYYTNMSLYILYNTLLLLVNPNLKSFKNYKYSMKGIYDGIMKFNY